MKILIIALATLCAFVHVDGQQKGLRRSKSDLRLVHDKPSIFVSYDHAGSRQPLNEGESNQGIWLRLHNNTRATIFLPSFSVPKPLGQAGLFYDIISTAQVKSYSDSSITATESNVQGLPIGYKLGHTSGAYLLQPGKSVLFSVPREHLPSRAALKISFNYEWELEEEMGSVRTGEPEHYVYFYSSQLPKTYK
jgi:hypothetical protein